MSQIVTKETHKLAKAPKQFEVLLLNDDYTPMEFVVDVLIKFFNKTLEVAQSIMLKVHIEGEAVCGTYSLDVAQTKVDQVISFSRKNDQPLMCIIREIFVR